MIRGSFDVVKTTEALGWAFSPGQTAPVLVQAVLNQEILGEAVADIHRPDLAGAGFGDGNAGFAIKFFRPIDPVYLPFIAVKVEGGDSELPRSPLLGFKEFLTSAHKAKPAAGRHRSVSGGLWTDRTDANALLQGKLRIGVITDETAPMVEQVVNYGFATLDLAGTPEFSSWRKDLTGNAADFLDSPEILPLLHAVLEDSPMAVKADWFEDDATHFSQPSTANPSPSPGECIELVVSFADGVSLDVIRDSHALPEFTVNGKSRWTADVTDAATAAASSAGLLDNISLPAGTAALVGPGTIYQIRSEAGAAALRLHVLPVRGRTVEITTTSTLPGEVRRSGAMVLI